MRVGITGATGVLGSRIVAALASLGYATDAFDGDVRHSASVDQWVDRVDAVIHCAAVVPIQQVADHAGTAIAINVGGTANVAAAAGKRGRRLVYISTSHVYRSNDQGLSEDDPIEPISLYGLTKLQGEAWVERLASRPLILRLFSYFDERQATSFLVPGLATRIGKADTEAKIDLFGGHNRRDMASAAWLAQACAALFAADATGIVNCATGSDRTVLEIAEAMARATKRSDIRWNVIQDRPVDALVSNNQKLRTLVPSLPPFDLDRALATYVRDAAPTESDGFARRLREQNVA